MRSLSTSPPTLVLSLVCALAGSVGSGVAARSETGVIQLDARRPTLCLHEGVEPKTPIVGLFIGISQFSSGDIPLTTANSFSAALMAEPFYHAARAATPESPVFLELHAPVYAYTDEEEGREVHESMVGGLHAISVGFFSAQSMLNADRYLDLALSGVRRFDSSHARESDWTLQEYVTKSSVLAYVRAAASKTVELRKSLGAATLVVYIASHGLIGPDGRQYILPSDADLSDPATWLAYEDVLEGVERARAGDSAEVLPYDTLVYFDACQATKGDPSELQPIDAPPGTIVVTSSSPGQWSYYWEVDQEIGTGYREVRSRRRSGNPAAAPDDARESFSIRFVAEMGVLPRAIQLALKATTSALRSSLETDATPNLEVHTSLREWARHVLPFQEDTLAEIPAYVDERDAKQEINVLEGDGLDAGPFLSLSVHTPLFRAAARNDAAAIARLVEAGADLSETDELGRTALIVAAGFGGNDAVWALIHAGADLHARDKEGTTAFVAAARNNHGKILKALVEAGVDLDRKDEEGNSDLLNAAARGDTEVTRALVLWGADIRVPDNLGRDPLMKAAQKGRFQTAAALINLGADVRPRNPYGNTALMYAARNESPDLMRLLIAEGAEVGALNDDGISALHIAASYGHSAAVLTLIDSGADVNAAGGGDTPLILAVESDCLLSTKILLGAGANVNAKGEHGNTGLMAAVRGKPPEWTRLFLDLSADVSAVNDHGITALMFAATSSSLATVKLLLDAGADVNGVSDSGETVLTFAATRVWGSGTVVAELIRRGADISATNREGKTALEIARELGRWNIAEVLEAAENLGTSGGRKEAP